MTINEAKETMLYMFCGECPHVADDCNDKECKQALDIIYEALEKQMPKKPLDVQTPVVTWGICPVCEGLPMSLGRHRRVMISEKYCSQCGQMIDWGDYDDD